MDKFLKKINPNDMLGRRIYSEEGEEYVVEYAAMSKKKGGLVVIFANEKDAQKDKEHQEGLRQLKDELVKQGDNFNEDRGNIWKIRYAQVVVYDALLTNGNDKEGYYCYVRSDNDSFEMLLKEETDSSIKSAERVRQSVYGKTGIVGGLRSMFRDLLGAEYTEALKKHFLDVAKKNIKEEIGYQESNLEEARLALERLRQREKDVYAEEGIKVFEELDEEDEELSRIDGEDEIDEINIDDLYLD